MNILPKKSWHVGSKNNIERVKRDQAEAKRIAETEQARLIQVEQEVRARELQARAGVTDNDDKPRPFNLFEGCNDRQNTADQLREKEEKQEREAWQERVGISKRLVRPNDINQPWYCMTGKESQSEVKPEHKSSRNLVTKMYDPMTAIKCAEEIVRKRRATSQIQRQSTGSEHPSKAGDSDSSLEIIREIGPAEKKKKKKHHHRKKRSKSSKKNHATHTHSHKSRDRKSERHKKGK